MGTTCFAIQIIGKREKEIKDGGERAITSYLFILYTPKYIEREERERSDLVFA